MKNLALFDFDHTLTTNDNFTNFIYYGVSSTRLAIGKVVLAPMLIAYKLRILPGTVLRQLIAWIGFYRVYTGRYRGGDCSGMEKARRIRKSFNLEAYSTIYAYGDSPEDEAMLSLAHKKFYRWKERT